MENIFQLLLTDPLLNLLILFYKLLFNSFGLAIVALTLILKILTLPLSIPSIKMLAKQKDIAGDLAEIKEKYGADKTLFAKKQMELYKKHGINPASGCLPQILQFVILLALYQVFLQFLSFVDSGAVNMNGKLYFDFLKFSETDKINTTFLYLDLAKPDKFYIMPVIAGVAQFVMSKAMMPKAVDKIEETAVKQTAEKSDDIMYNMQKQMMYMGPAMTVFLGANFQSGLVFYWFLQTLFSAFSQWILTKKK
jgi:YidC/Oxa1 family membrane protein insertase